LAAAPLRVIRGGGGARKPRPDIFDRVHELLGETATTRSLIRRADRAIEEGKRARRALEATLRMFADPVRRAVRG
jgi:hypothetical protein